MKAMLKKVIAGVLLVPAIVLGVAVTSSTAVYAVEGCDDVTTGGISKGADCAKPGSAPGQLFGENSIFSTVTDILLFVIGAIAVIMLIIGGIKYVVSQGDQTAVASAKNTILYAIIGIVVAFLAYAAVKFVTGQLNKGTDTETTTTSIVTTRIV